MTMVLLYSAIIMSQLLYRKFGWRGYLSSLAQWKRARPITERTMDRNHQLLFVGDHPTSFTLKQWTCCTIQQKKPQPNYLFDLAISMVLATIPHAPIAQLVRAPCLQFYYTHRGFTPSYAHVWFISHAEVAGSSPAGSILGQCLSHTLNNLFVQGYFQPWWCSGNIVAFQAIASGSIPGWGIPLWGRGFPHNTRCSSVGRAMDCSGYNIPSVPGSNPGGETFKFLIVIYSKT